MLLPVATKTGNYTLVETDLQIRGDASGGDFTLTLPSVGVGRLFIIRNVGATGKVTVAAPTSIDGAASLALTSKGDVIWAVSLGGGVYETLSRSIASASEEFDITFVPSIAASYAYSPGFVPRLVLLLHANGSSCGIGFASGTGVGQQGAFFRAFAASTVECSPGLIARYAAGHSAYAVTAFGATVTISRVMVTLDLANVVLVAFK